MVFGWTNAQSRFGVSVTTVSLRQELCFESGREGMQPLARASGWIYCFRVCSRAVKHNRSPIRRGNELLA